MNRFVLVCLLLLSRPGVQASQSGGIQFFTGSWQQALAEARRNQDCKLYKAEKESIPMLPIPA